MPGHKHRRTWKPHHEGPKSQKQKPKPREQSQNEVRKSAESSGQVSDFFLETFQNIFTPALPELIQQVKQDLYKRDYKAAFGSQEHLEAYAVQWSVSRAMAYREMILDGWLGQDLRRLLGAQKEFDNEVLGSDSGKATSSQVAGLQDESISIVSIGGGAGAEVAGFSAVLSTLAPETLSPKDIKDQEPLEQKIEDLKLEEQTVKKDFQTSKKLHLAAFDFGSWGPITKTLESSITSDTAGHALHIPSSHFTVDFDKQDVLQPMSAAAKETMSKAHVVTIFFTAGELYTQSPTLATKFLLSLYAQTKLGCLLVVVDSAGGFQDVDLGRPKATGEEEEEVEVEPEQEDEYEDDEGQVRKAKKVPEPEPEVAGFKLGFILDKTLTHKGHWEKTVSEDAKWWRVPESLKEKGRKAYPLPLESMRCLIRVYRRLPGTA